MARTSIKLPKLGDTTEEILVATWLAEVGDVLSVGDPLLLAETDKTEVEVPSPVAGRLTERTVAEQDEVATGATIAIMET